MHAIMQREREREREGGRKRERGREREREREITSLFSHSPPPHSPSMFIDHFPSVLERRIVWLREAARLPALKPVYH